MGYQLNYRADAFAGRVRGLGACVAVYLKIVGGGDRLRNSDF